MRHRLLLAFAAAATGILSVALIGAEDRPAAEAKIWEVVPNPPGVTKPRWIDAGKDGNLYVASLLDGFHMSKDSGKTWVSINGTGLTIQANGSPNGFTIQVDPNTGNLIAGQADDKTKRAYYFISTDQGKNWTMVEGYKVGNAPANDGVCFLPNGDILFGGFWQPAQNIGVFYSTDHGKTCKRAEGNNPLGVAFSIGYNPVTKECWMGSEAEGKVISHSTDMGRTWAHVPTPMKLPDVFADAMHVAFNDAGNVLFETMQGLYRTQDKGATWEEVYNSGSAAGSAGCLRKDPNGYLYVGNGMVWRKNPPIARSKAGGDKGTWEDFSAGIPRDYHATCIVYNPRDGRMYCVCKDDKAKPRTAQVHRTIEPVYKPGAKHEK